MGTVGALAGHQILVVEDDFFLADELGRNLEAAGAEVIGPFSRVDGVMDTVRAGASTVSAAVLDVNIGGGTVYSLANELRRAGIPFVFATGYDARAIPGEFAAVPRLVKPVERRRLLDCLMKITLR